MYSDSKYDDEHKIHDSFEYSSKGYADLTDKQLYTLIKALESDFSCLELESELDTDMKLKDAIKKSPVGLHFNFKEQYDKSIIASEIQKMRSLKSPYKNAF